MSISSAMYAGITGLNANGEALNVVGDNIANMNTTGFKYSRAYFEDLLAQNITVGGGISQVGRGTQLSTVSPIFSQGSLEASDNSTAMAISGNGFFEVQDPNNTANLYYTRDGNFQIDKDGYLVNTSGYQVQGKAIDQTTGNPTGVDTSILINQNYAAPKATGIMALVLNLNDNAAAGDTYSTSMAVYDSAGNSHTLQANFQKDPGTAQVDNVTLGAGNTAGLNNSYWLISSPSTDYFVWYNVDGLGAAPTVTGRTAIEVAVNSGDTDAQVAAKTATALTATGVFTVPTPASNIISVTDVAGGIPNSAIGAGTTPAAFGWADTPVTVGVDPLANTWIPTFKLDGASLTGPFTNLVFNDNGTWKSGGSYNLTLGTNWTSTLNMVNTDGGTTTQYASSSVTNYSTQDGYPPGYLTGITVSTDGIIHGKYSNGQNLSLYQTTLARFNTPAKLSREGNNLYSETTDSGVPLTGAPGTNGLGVINGNSLEQSNVDLGNEFVHMILYQRGFQANSRVITTTDSLLEEVLSLKR